MRKASPEPAPPAPATNSATTAPIRRRPPATRSPARKKGSAEGRRRISSVCQRVAPCRRNSSCRLRSALFRPSTVLDRIGKKATIQAQISSAAVTLSTQIRISGAMATIGVTCRITA
jgi:hypothetical protein